jgi:hypothetical protein
LRIGRRTLILPSVLSLVHITGPHLVPVSADGPFSMVRTIPVSKPLAPLSNLQNLCLMANQGIKYAVQDPPAFWALFPALRCLKLQNVGLGFQQSGDINPDRAVTVVGAPQAANGGLRDRLLLWLKDLPCLQLQRLELSRCNIVFDESDQGVGESAWVIQPAPSTYSSSSSGVGYSNSDGMSRLAKLSLQEQQPAVAAAAVQAQGSAAHDNNNSGIWLRNLQELTLVDCSFLMVPPSEQRGRDVSTPCPVLSSQLMHLLTSMMADDSSSSRDNRGYTLRSLKLHSVSLGFMDLAAVISSDLGNHLEELEVHTASWSSRSTGAQRQQPDIAKALAAAVHAGGLQKLRRLSLCIEEPRPAAPGRGHRMLRPALLGSISPLGLSVLSACCQLRSLQQLRLTLSEQDGHFCTEAGWCACRASYGPFGMLNRESELALVPAFAGYWQKLLLLRNLRVCNVRLQCFQSMPVQPGPHPADQRRAAVVDVCVRCGRAVSLSDLCLWMQSVAAAGLTGCQVHLDVVDCSPETTLS